MWRTITSIDRSVYLFWLGVIALVLAITQSWYSLPDSGQSGLGLIPSKQFVLHTPLVVFLYKVSGAALGVFLIYAWTQNMWHSERARAFLWTFLLLLLGFSYFINQWSPQTLMDSSILHYEMTRVIIDMEENITHQQRDWRVNQIIMGEWDNPAFFFLQFPHEDRWAWSLLLPGNQLHLLVNIFGLSNAFQTFASRGWFLAISGVVIVLFAQYLHVPEGGRRLRSDLKPAATLAVVLLTMALIPRALSGWHLQAGDNAQARGEYGMAIEHWQQAIHWRPDLNYSLLQHRKIGQAQLQKHCFDCFDAHLAYAYDAVLKLNYHEVFRRLELAQAQRPDYEPLRYWMAVARSEHAVNLFDLGHVSQAKDQWSLALRQVPILPMAWYGTMLANIRMHQFDAAALDAERLWWLHGYFGFKHLTLRAQSWVTRSWGAFHQDNMVEAHRYYSNALTPDNW